MDIRSKLYPYPVLSSANDDYTGSSFTFTPNISKGPREVVFDFALNLQDSTLQQLIGEGQAEFVIHIECPYTAFREIIRCSSESCSRHIVESRLNGKVSVCAFIAVYILLSTRTTATSALISSAAGYLRSAVSAALT